MGQASASASTGSVFELETTIALKSTRFTRLRKVFNRAILVVRWVCQRTCSLSLCLLLQMWGEPPQIWEPFSVTSCDDQPDSCAETDKIFGPHCGMRVALQPWEKWSRGFHNICSTCLWPANCNANGDRQVRECHRDGTANFPLYNHLEGWSICVGDSRRKLKCHAWQKRACPSVHQNGLSGQDELTNNEHILTVKQSSWLTATSILTSSQADQSASDKYTIEYTKLRRRKELYLEEVQVSCHTGYEVLSPISVAAAFCAGRYLI